MNVSHTPAPWIVASYSAGTQAVNGPDGRLVAFNVLLSSSDQQPIANARLIAASPELFAELVALLSRAEAVGLDTSTARAVIQKATGGI
jgi:hypothetical protein